MYIYLVVEVLCMVLIEVRNVPAAIGGQQIGRETTVNCTTSSGTCFKGWYVEFFLYVISSRQISSNFIPGSLMLKLELIVIHQTH